MGLLDEAIREHLALKRGRGADPAEIAREEKDALGPPTRTQEPQAERAREERGESEDAPLDEPATALAPADDAPRAGREPGEPRLRLAAEPPEHEEPRPAPEGRGDRATGAPPPAEHRLRITEDELRGHIPGGAGPPSPPPPADDALPEPADDEPHTDDFVFGDEDEDIFADAVDEPRVGERHADGPPPEPPPAPPAPEPPPAPPAPEPPPAPDQPTQQYALEDVEDAVRPPGPPPSVPDADEYDEPEGEELLEETPEFLEETPEHDRLWFEQKPPRDFDF